MAFYREKDNSNIVVEAVQWKNRNTNEISKFLGEKYGWQVIKGRLRINTGDWVITVNDDEYIIKDQFGLCSRPSELFEKFYEPLTEEKTDDKVNHPNHYTFGSIEVIDYIRDKMTPDEFQGYCMGNILKYISRHKHKAGVEDLKKAQVYLGWLIESEEEQK